MSGLVVSTKFSRGSIRIASSAWLSYLRSQPHQRCPSRAVSSSYSPRRALGIASTHTGKLARNATFEGDISSIKLEEENPYLKVSEEVRSAIEAQNPVVALETAIYTHGFPYPENVALASHLESVVRVNGGIPATVGILNGIARVGFEPEELIELAASAGKPDTKKVSRRDLSYVCGLGFAGQRLHGGTTISGTMALASHASIKVFATGGLGGVHRGGERSLDISADLTELGRTNMAVISSGCKSFLDLARTLEYLETQGVFVGTFADGRSGQVDFPAFWTRESGIKSPVTISDETEAAAMIRAMIGIPIQSGLLFANPVPAEYSVAKSEMDAIISQAIQDAKNAGSIGSANTPFILNRIREISKGGSIAANRALIEANVIRGTRVAVLMSDMEAKASFNLNRDRISDYEPDRTRSVDSKSQQPSRAVDIRPHEENHYQRVVVAGSLAMDLSCNYSFQGNSLSSSQPQLQTSNPSHIKQSIGGVGHNVASALHYMGVSVRLCSSVANDLAGSTALSSLAKRRLSTEGIRTLVDGSRTAQYVAVNDNQGNLFLAMADMRIFDSKESGLDQSWQHQLHSCNPRWLVIDTNWDVSTLQKWIHAGKASGAKVAVEPVSIAKSKRIFARSSADSASLGTVPKNVISLATPNALELRAMHEAAASAGFFEREDWFQVIDSFGLSNSGSRPKLVSMTNSSLVDQGVPQQSIQLLPFIPCILTTLGERGVLMTQILQPEDDHLTSPDSAPYILSRSTGSNGVVGGIYMRLFSPIEKVPVHEVVSVNGVGDTFLGVIVAGLAKEKPKDVAVLIDIAQRASILTLRSAEAVNPGISALLKAL